MIIRFNGKAFCKPELAQLGDLAGKSLHCLPLRTAMRGVPVCCSSHPLAKFSMVCADGTGPYVARVQWVRAVGEFPEQAASLNVRMHVPSQNITRRPRRRLSIRVSAPCRLHCAVTSR